MRFLIIFIFLITHVTANEYPNIKNLIINKESKSYENITFLDSNGIEVKLSDFRGNLILINFWATWCEPCKKEMPSLDDLKTNSSLDNLKIFPINIGKDSPKRSSEFFKDLDIKNLNIYFDNPVTLAKKFKLRGIPTTILFNKKGEEFARIVGSIDFNEKSFLEWIKLYN